MSFGRPPTFTTLLPPERGSFPLDHDGVCMLTGECKDLVTDYLRCLKNHKNDNGQCRHLSKAYLECRMNKCVLANSNLMERDDMDNLGFGDLKQSPEGGKKL